MKWMKYIFVLSWFAMLWLASASEGGAVKGAWVDWMLIGYGLFWAAMTVWACYRHREDMRRETYRAAKTAAADYEKECKRRFLQEVKEERTCHITTIVPIAEHI